jgi:hypothetical protein
MITQPNLPAYQRLVRWLGDRFRRQFIFFLGLTLAFVAVNEVALFGAQIARGDFLFITGIITFVVVLRLAVEIPYH